MKLYVGNNLIQEVNVIRSSSEGIVIDKCGTIEIGQKLNYDISSCVVSGMDEKYYILNEHQDSVIPTFVVSNNFGYPLVQDFDYRIQLSDNDQVGMATLTLIGIGKYHGNTSIQFEICLLQKARYFKFVVDSVKGTSCTYMQLSRLEFIDQNDHVFNYPYGVSATNQYENSVCGNVEGPLKILDHSTSTKLCTALISGKTFPISFIYDMKENILDIKEYSRWRWYTANDVTDRDPKDFSLYLSFNGDEWFLVDQKQNFIATNNRNSLAYTGTIGSIQ